MNVILKKKSEIWFFERWVLGWVFSLNAFSVLENIIEYFMSPEA